MNSILEAWVSVNQAGSGIFPYLGVAVVCIIVLVCLGLMLYLCYRILKRLPPFLRYLGWALFRMSIRIKSRLSRSAVPSGEARIRIGTSGVSRSLGTVFSKKAMAADAAKPLVVLLGMGSIDDGVIETAMGLTTQPDDGSCATWWSLPNKAVLQIHLENLGQDTKRVTRIFTRLQQARREPPVGLVVNLSLRNSGGIETTHPVSMPTLQKTLQALGEHIGYRLPLWVTITPSAELRGGTEASRILGYEQLAALMRWEAHSLDETFNPEELQRSGDRTLNAIVLALAHDEQFEDISVQERSRALTLPQSWLQLSGILSFLRAHENASIEAAAAFPRFQALDILVPASPVGPQESVPDKRPPNFELAPWARQHYARPQANPTRERQRRRSALKSAAVALGVTIVTMGTVATTLRTIDNDARLLRMSASRIAQEISKSRNGDLNSDSDSELAEPTTRQVVEMLHSILEASHATGGYIAIPRSWLGGPRSRLQIRQGELLRRHIVAPRVRTLSYSIRDVAELPMDTQSAVTAHSLEELPSYASFRGFIERKRLTLTSLDTAQDLVDHATYQSVLTLLDQQAAADALQSVDLKESLPARVREQLRMGEIFDEIVQKNAQQHGPRAWEQVLEEALDQHPLLVDAKAIEKALESLVRGRESNVTEVSEIARLLNRLRMGVQARDARRLLGKPLDTASFFSGGLTSLVRAGGLSVSQMADATEAIQSHRERTRRKLLLTMLPGDVRMFSEGSDGRMELTSDFVRIASAWSVMNAQQFMTLPILPTSAAIEYASGWDLGRLQPLRDLQTNLREFLDSGIGAFDTSLRPTLRRLVIQRSRAVTRSIMLESALSPSDRLDLQTGLDPLMSLRPQISNIVAAGNLYRQTLARDEQFEEDDPAATLLRRSAQRKLVQLKTSLKADDPYASIVRDVGMWMKNSDSALAMATTLGGPPKERLTMAREYIVSQYATNASALLDVAMLGAPSASARDPDLKFWRLFLDKIEGFDKGATANGLVEFEQYLLTLGKLGSPDDCERFLIEWPVVVRREDHFSQQLTALEQTVAATCKERSEDIRHRVYESYAQWFNTEISNRSPFGAPNSVPIARSTLLSALDRYAQLRVKLGNSRNWAPTVAEFMSRMDDLYVLFVGSMPLTDSGIAQPSAKIGGVNPKIVGSAAQEGSLVTQPVRFHVRLRGQEDDSDLVKHIIDPTMTIGERTVSVRSASSALEWRPGEPIEVRLRWAANSSYTPVGAPGSAYKVSGRTAVFSFSGDWALSNLLNDTVAMQTLRETLVTLPVTVIGRDGRAEVNFRLRLVDPNGAPLRMVFPKRAPLLNLNKSLTPSLRIKRADAI
jgi:hypothetical protein